MVTYPKKDIKVYIYEFLYSLFPKIFKKEECDMKTSKYVKLKSATEKSVRGSKDTKPAWFVTYGPKRTKELYKLYGKHGHKLFFYPFDKETIVNGSPSDNIVEFSYDGVTYIYTF